MGPNSSVKCPYKRHTKRKAKRRRGSKASTRAETGVMWPKPKENLQPPEVGRDKELIVPLSLWREYSPAETLISDF